MDSNVFALLDSKENTAKRETLNVPRANAKMAENVVKHLMVLLAAVQLDLQELYAKERLM